MYTEAQLKFKGSVNLIGIQQPPRLPEVWRADKYINMIRGNISAGNICGQDEKQGGDENDVGS